MITMYVEIDAFIQNLRNHIFTVPDSLPIIEVIAKLESGTLWFCPSVACFNQPEVTYVLDWVNGFDTYQEVADSFDDFYSEASQDAK